MADLTAHLQALRDEVEQTTTPDTRDRALMRARLSLDALYDDDPDEPEVALGDALIDLVHLARDRGIDFDDATMRAQRTADMETEERSEERRVGKECRSRWSPYL